MMFVGRFGRVRTRLRLYVRVGNSELLLSRALTEAGRTVESRRLHEWTAGLDSAPFVAVHHVLATQTYS